MRCIPLPLAAGASLVLLIAGSGSGAASPAADSGAEPTVEAAADPAVGPPVDPLAGPVPAEGLAASLETQMIPELDQTVFYVRFSRAVGGSGTLEIHDAAGEVRASIEIPVVAGTGLFVWDGRNTEGERLPSDLYEARWIFGEVEATAPLVR